MRLHVFLTLSVFGLNSQTEIMRLGAPRDLFDPAFRIGDPSGVEFVATPGGIRGPKDRISAKTLYAFSSAKGAK